jgi:hypothetical protein
MTTGSVAILASITTLFEAKYQLNALHVGLVYIPYGIGGLAARWTVGTLADWNFQRFARQAGITLIQNRQTAQQLQDMPLEKCRLQLSLPLVYASVFGAVVYGWVMHSNNVHIAGPLVLLFVLGNTVTGSQNTLIALIIDLHSHRPATASASLGLFRSLAGAGVAAAVIPLIEAIGIGWTGTWIAASWLLASLPLWLVYFHGHGWRLEVCIDDLSNCGV